MPSLQDLEKPESDVASELYSSDNLLLGKYFRYNRSPVEFNELSNELITTLLVTEDIRFYDHSGIDFKGLVRASYGVAKNVLTFGGSGLEGGGSTITQQLAKNLFKIRREKKGKLSGVPFLGLVISKVSSSCVRWCSLELDVVLLFAHRHDLRLHAARDYIQDCVDEPLVESVPL